MTNSHCPLTSPTGPERLACILIEINSYWPTNRECDTFFGGVQALELRDAYRNSVRHPWESDGV